MTSLASVLANPPKAVVHSVPPEASVVDIERAVRAAGCEFALVESAEARDKLAVLDAFAEGLGLPDWFGRNLDALVDSLRDVGAHDTATVLLWDRPDEFKAQAPEAHTAVLDILAERAADQDRPRFVALVRSQPKG